MTMVTDLATIPAAAKTVLVGPGAQIANPAHFLLRSPQFDWASDQNNYTALHFDPQAGNVRVVFHAGDGDVMEERTYRP